MFCRRCNNFFYGCRERHKRVFHGKQRGGFFVKLLNFQQVERPAQIFEEVEVFEIILSNLTDKYDLFHSQYCRPNVPERFLRKIFVARNDNIDLSAYGVFHEGKDFLHVFVAFCAFFKKYFEHFSDLASYLTRLTDFNVPHALDPSEILYSFRNNGVLVSDHFFRSFFYFLLLIEYVYCRRSVNIVPPKYATKTCINIYVQCTQEKPISNI